MLYHKGFHSAECPLRGIVKHGNIDARGRPTCRTSLLVLTGKTDYLRKLEKNRQRKVTEKNYAFGIKFSIILYDQDFREEGVSKTVIGSLEPGMVLAKPVVNKGGLVMIGEGTELNDSLIEKIREMGGSSVHIRGITQPDMPKEEMLALLDKRFSGVEEKPYMGLIKQALKEHIEGLYG